MKQLHLSNCFAFWIDATLGNVSLQIYDKEGHVTFHWLHPSNAQGMNSYTVHCAVMAIPPHFVTHTYTYVRIMLALLRYVNDEHVIKTRTTYKLWPIEQYCHYNSIWLDLSSHHERTQVHNTHVGKGWIPQYPGFYVHFVKIVVCQFYNKQISIDQKIPRQSSIWVLTKVNVPQFNEQATEPAVVASVNLNINY